jgi:NADP-dependent 3-hydroxy acid dehydrogenase YdfG
MKEILNDKIICISGATSGLGLSLSHGFLSAGAKVIGFGSKSPEHYEGKLDIDENYSRNGKFELVGCDIYSEQSVYDLVQYICVEYGRIDVLINNAGVGIFKQITDTDEEAFDRMLNVNLRGAFFMMREFGKQMLEQDNGIIMNINSVTINELFSSCGVYSASKAGLKAISDTFRKEIRHKNVKILDLILGATVSGIWSPKVIAKYSERMMNPIDVADVAITNIALMVTNPSIMIEEILLKPQHGDL